MTASGRNNEIPASSPAKKVISAHRAFIYGASIPGWGEIYAGSRVQGIFKAAAALFLGIWFTWVLVDTVGSIMGQVFDSLNSMTPFVMPDVSMMSMGISFFGLYYIWLWAMISSVDAAVACRRNDADPPQTSIAWAFAMSWLCPGSGHIYAGSRRFGYILFVIFLLGILLIVPVYVDLVKNISELAKSGKLSTNNPYGLINIVHGFMVKMDFSFGKLFQACVRYVAIAGAICALRQGLLESDNRWSKPSIAYGLALIVLGWFCPGAGQLLQKRIRTGYTVLAGYIGSKFIIGFLLGNDVITTQSAETLDWISVLIQWSAMIEALFQMMKGGWAKRQSDNSFPLP